MKQREVPRELHSIGKVQSIDKFNEKVEILRNFFRNLLFIEIYAQIRKAVGEIAHERSSNERKCLGFFIIINKNSILNL
jgi:hypothetical protein